jgi:hypothetical protein
VGNEIYGGLFFGPVIQGRQITVQLPREIRPALGGLPPRTPSFSGRARELAALCGSLGPGSVTVTSGLAGIGKAELAVQAAWRVWKDERLFPGGVLFVDMFGYDDQRRLTPERALDGLVRAVGVPPEQVPVGDQELIRSYRRLRRAVRRPRAGARLSPAGCTTACLQSRLSECKHDQA